MTVERIEVVIVGGGLAGAALAARLASAGREVALIERLPSWRWRAAGVFASPAAVTALRRLGLEEGVIGRVARPTPALRVETPGGATFRLTYGADSGGDLAVGFDRSRLDPALLELARRAGADVRPGWTAITADPAGGRIDIREPAGTDRAIRADVIVGADGLRSIVARSAGVSRPSRLGARLGLTYHLADDDPGSARDARMRLIRDGYVGIAPVPDGRVNIGIVLGRSWHRRVALDGPRSVADSIIHGVPRSAEDRGTWRDRRPTDSVVGAWPLAHRVTRRAGLGWLLVGDAAGFLDPFTGEGIHRALVSAELAAGAITAHRRGRPQAFAVYERAMQRRFLAKEVVSWVVQAFLARPAAFEYAARRLAARAAPRATLGLVMGDLVGAGQALDPRYLAALLAP
ncbi:MAG: NAD(P)/FAD-dependent oxidoreductase [Candidatus Limnocylindrales bacterium]